jgi:hypothetical protein
MAMTTAPQRGPHRAERLFGSAYPHRTLGLFFGGASLRELPGFPWD